MGLQEQLELARKPGVNKPVGRGGQSINQAQELAREQAYLALHRNKDVCLKFKKEEAKKAERLRIQGNSGVHMQKMKEGEFTFYIAPDGKEIKIQKDSTKSFEEYFREILEQLPSVLEKETFNFDTYFPTIKAIDKSETIPKKSTKTYIQNIFRLLFFRLYGAGVSKYDHHSNEYLRKKEARDFLREKFGLKSLGLSRPTDITNTEINYFKHDKNKR